MSLNISDKRLFPRCDIRQPIHYRIDGSREILKGRIANIGGGGLCIQTRIPLKKNDRLSVEFDIPGGAGSAIATADIVWAGSASDSDYETRHLAGIKFRNIPDRKLESIIKYVDRRIKTASVIAEPSMNENGKQAQL